MEDYIPAEWAINQSLIKVIGVGGGGGNAVNQMFLQGIQDVDFLICNTDIMALKSSPVPDKLQLGNILTKGLGAGCNPEQGKKAAMESEPMIKEKLSGSTEMVFITAGMGGGTGTGAAPIIAKVAKEMGLLTVAVVTLPFRDEGKEFMRRAVIGIRELEKFVDSLLIIDNQKLYEIFGNLNIFEAFPKADSVLSSAVKGIAEIITRPGFINVDFADVRMVMSNSGMALMGTGTAIGENRAIKAVEEAFSSPLLNDFDLKTARSVLVNITSSKEKGLTMAELSQIMDYIREYTGGSVEKFKRGVVNDPEIGDAVSITIVATGFDMQSLPQISFSEHGNEIEEKVTLGEMHNRPKSAPVAPLEDLPASRPDKLFGRGTPVTSERGFTKPALIIGAEDDISLLENKPAYLRRNVKLNKDATQDHQEDLQPKENMKIEENNGTHRLTTDNSYLHQTQD